MLKDIYGSKPDITAEDSKSSDRLDSSKLVEINYTLIPSDGEPVAYLNSPIGQFKQTQFRAAIPVLIKRIDPDVQIPTMATIGSAGVDLTACIKEELILEPGTVALIPSGIAIHIQSPAYMAMLVPRSGLGHKHGIVLGNLTGIIDSDYQGQIMISCWNRSSTPYTIQPNDKIAQMIFVPTFLPSFTEVDSFEATERGIGGFGHSGR